MKVRKLHKGPGMNVRAARSVLLAWYEAKFTRILNETVARLKLQREEEPA